MSIIENTPSAFPTSSLNMNALINICWEDKDQTKLLSVVKAKHYKRDQTIHIINELEIIEQMGRYHRDAGPFKIVRQFFVKKFLGDDSFLTCNASDTKELRGILINFLKKIKNEDLVTICFQQFEKFTKNWKDHVNLSQEIPLLIAHIGIREILGFTGDIDKLCCAIQTVSAVEPKNQSFWKKSVRGLSEFYARWTISSEIRNHLKAELAKEEDLQHPYLKAMHAYALTKFKLTRNEAFPKEALDMLVHVWIVLLNALQEPISSLVTHLTWKIAQETEIQREFAEIAIEAKKFLPDHPQQYFHAIDPFKALIEEGLRLFSPTGFDRTMEEDKLVTFANNDYKFAVGEKIEYIPYLIGQSPQLFKNPEKLDPSRFSQLASHSDQMGKNLPKHFGLGVHICPGQEKARSIMNIVISLILGTFSFTTKIDKLTFYQKSILKSYEEVIVQIKRNK